LASRFYQIFVADLRYSTNGAVSNKGKAKNIPYTLKEGSQIKVVVNPEENKKNTIFYVRIILKPNENNNEQDENREIKNYDYKINR
jgi:hypothetical protein